jgi:O-antigen/teichoic acid export membrane protein
MKDLDSFALASFATTFARFGIRLLKNIVFTRLLGPTDRGMFGLLTTVPDLVVNMGNLGYGLGSTFMVAKKRSELAPVVANTLVVTAILGVGLAAVGYGVFSYEGLLKGDRVSILRYAPLVIAMIPLVLLQNFTSDLLQSIKQIHFLNFLKLLLSGLPVPLFALLWLFSRRPLPSALGAWAVTLAVLGLWSTVRLVKNSGLSRSMSIPDLKESFSYGLRGYASILANAVTRRIDYLFIASLAGAEALGYYTVAVSMAEILLAVPEAFSRPFLPIYFGLADRDAKRFTPLVIRSVLLVMLLLCLGTAVGGKAVILVLYGRSFMPAFLPMILLLPGVLALSIYPFLKVDLFNRNRPGMVSWNSLFAMGCNVALNFLLIPSWGIVGAAVSSSLAYGLSTAGLLVRFARLSGTPWREILIVRRADLGPLWERLRRR